MDSTKIDIEKEIQEENEDISIDDLNNNQNEEKTDDSKSILVTIAIIVGLFVFAIVGFKFYNSITGGQVIVIDDLHQQNLEDKLDEDEGYVYNGFSFVKVDGLWWTQVKRFNTLVKIPLHFGPKELEEINVDGKVSPEFNKELEIYLSIDPRVANKYYTLSITELSNNMAKGINRLPVAACIKEDPVCEGRPILNCDDPKGIAVVEFAIANETSIKADGTCIKISGKEYDLVKATDRVLYKWYGVMD